MEPYIVALLPLAVPTAVMLAPLMAMTATALIQVPTPPPTDLVALQWVVIVALAGVVGYLYRQNSLLQGRYVELLEKVLEGLAGSRETMDDLLKQFENFGLLTDIKAEVERLSDEKRRN
jgi:hypothetical protein